MNLHGIEYFMCVIRFSNPILHGFCLSNKKKSWKLFDGLWCLWYSCEVYVWVNHQLLVRKPSIRHQSTSCCCCVAYSTGASFLFGVSCYRKICKSRSPCHNDNLCNVMNRWLLISTARYFLVVKSWSSSEKNIVLQEYLTTLKAGRLLLYIGWLQNEKTIKKRQYELTELLRGRKFAFLSLFSSCYHGNLQLL